MNSAESWVVVARIVRPQGRRGEVIAELLTDFPERFASMREAYFSHGPSRTPDRTSDRAPVRAKLERSWLHRDRVVLKFAGIDSIPAAEALRGVEIVVPASERVPLEPGAAYIDDLAGCQLVDSSRPDQPPVGAIVNVIRQENAPDLLVVRSADGQERWIPFAEAYRARIDIKARRVEMDLPAGLLEIDAPVTEEERRRKRESPAIAREEP